MVRRFPYSLAFLFSTLTMLYLLTTTLVAAPPVAELGAPVDVSFPSKWDGSEQRYVVRLPMEFENDRPHDLLIALHGHGSDRWQFINDQRDECRAARDVAARHRMIYVSPDYRAKTSWMGPAAEADMMQMLDDLHRTYRIRRVFISGGSMGGTAALTFAVIHPEMVDGVVSMNGTANLVEYDSFQDAIASSYGGSKAEKPDEYQKRSAELHAERLTMPIGLTTGGRDTLVPPESVLRLAERLKQDMNVHLIHRSDGGHQTSYSDAIEAFQFVIDKSRSAESNLKPVLTFASEPRTIVCLGDSVTGVYYHTGGRRAYPEIVELGLRQLFPQTPITVINAGISGNTTKNGLERLESDVLSKSPNLVTISFGLNDMVGLTPDVFRENIEKLVDRCRERNSQVVLCTPNAVIDTTGRPIDKLRKYCEIIREVARNKQVPLCDQYQAGTELRLRAPWTWRLTLSDEIHPNMDGHKRMAEELCHTITAKRISLDAIKPPSPLRQVKALLKDQKPVRVLAMAPYDALIASALKSANPTANIEVTKWSVEGKTIVELEKEAQMLVRARKPDLVVLAVPREAATESDEQYVHSFSWIMNWSLSFGMQEWDCVVVHPSIAAAGITHPRDDLARTLVKAQHLDLIDRKAGDNSLADKLITDWFVTNCQN